MTNVKDPGSLLLSLEKAEKSIQANAEFIRQVLSHSGEIGTEVENIFKAALRRVLPERIGITSGFVVDSFGNMSKQLDIILYDINGAVNIVDGDIAVLPAECTYAAGEVKTVFYKRSIHDCFEKCRSFKSLNRNSQISENSYTIYGEIDENWPPLFFALGLECVDNGLLRVYAKEAIAKNDLDFRTKLDTFCSLDGKMLINANVKGVREENGRILVDVAEADWDSISHSLDRSDGNAPLIIDANGIQTVQLCGNSSSVFLPYASGKPWALFSAMLNTVLIQAPPTKVQLVKYPGQASL